MASFYIAWTTLPSEEAATTLAQALIDQQLAACVQLEGPITSFYRWDKKSQKDIEYRLTIKFPEGHAQDIQEFVLENHPYEVPQWIVIQADAVSPSYLKWAIEATET